MTSRYKLIIENISGNNHVKVQDLIPSAGTDEIFHLDFYISSQTNLGSLNTIMSSLATGFDFTAFKNYQGEMATLDSDDVIHISIGAQDPGVYLPLDFSGDNNTTAPIFSYPDTALTSLLTICSTPRKLLSGLSISLQVIIAMGHSLESPFQ